MVRYLIALVWVLRIMALGQLIFVFPYVAGNFVWIAEAHPFGTNVLAALEILSTPLVMAGVAECLALLVRERQLKT